MRRRLLVAAAAGLVAGLTALGVAWVLTDAFACRAPASWWPGWAWPCLDEASRRVARWTEVGWDTALPLLIGAAVFLGVGLSRGR